MTPDPTVTIAEGAIRGVVYDFPAVGDSLPDHVHDIATAHLTIVARGAVQIRGQRFEAGAAVVLGPGLPHSIIALEPHSRVYNLLTKA